MHIPNGDLRLAKDYLEVVAISNSEDVGKAADLLKQVKVMIDKKFNARLLHNNDRGTVIDPVV